MENDKTLNQVKADEETMNTVTGVLKLRVKVTKIETETTKFNAYKVLNKQKKWVDLRFTQDVKNLPEKDCYIYVHTDNINYSTAYQYPRFWVRAIDRIEEIEIAKQDMAEFFDKDNLPY